MKFKKKLKLKMLNYSQLLNIFFNYINTQQTRLAQGKTVFRHCDLFILRTWQAHNSNTRLPFCMRNDRYFLIFMYSTQGSIVPPLHNLFVVWCDSCSHIGCNHWGGSSWRPYYTDCHRIRGPSCITFIMQPFKLLLVVSGSLLKLYTSHQIYILR